METAYDQASDLEYTGVGTDNLDINVGDISGTTFTEGVYRWGSDVTFSSDITITGNKDSKFVFQSFGNVIASDGAEVVPNPKPETLNLSL